MRKLAVLALALAVPVAALAASESGYPPSSVVPHTTLTLASIGASKAFTAGLEDMASNPKGWDKIHAATYMDQIKVDLQFATEHLSHLAPAARGNPSASSDLLAAQSALGRAQQAVGGWSSSMSPDAVASGAKSVWKDLDSAGSKVGDLAKALGAPGKLGSP